jgi:hypothetical protein
LIIIIHADTNTALKAGMTNLSNEFVNVLFPVDIESNLPGLVRNAVSNLWAEHHLAAPHEVIHAVF